MGAGGGGCGGILSNFDMRLASSEDQHDYGD